MPEKVEVKAGRLAAVTIDWVGDDCKWAAPADLDVFREYDGDPSRIRLRLIGYANGRHEIKAVACKGGRLGDFATCVVVVGDPAPVPPVPPPVPPGPDGPLAAAVKAAYARETDAGKASQLASLAALYSGAVEYAGKPEVATWGQLFALMKTAAGSMGLAGKLPLVQGAVAAELVKVLPTSAGLALDAAGRKLAADTFRRVASALEAK